MRPLCSSEILKIADAVDGDALDDNDFLVVASQLVNLYGGSKDIRSGCVARDKDGYRVALFIVRGGYDRDELSLEAIPYKPAYVCTESSWWTAHNAGEIILDDGPWTKIGFSLNLKRTPGTRYMHTHSCSIHVDKLSDDSTFWTDGNVVMFAQALQLMAEARDIHNIDLAAQSERIVADAIAEILASGREVVAA